MDNRLSGATAISPELRAAGQALLASAQKTVAASGENRDSMHAIGGLLWDLTGSGVLDSLLGTRPGGDTASIDLVGEHPDGSNLSLYAMNGWESDPKNDVHWHNYWQSRLMGGH